MSETLAGSQERAARPGTSAPPPGLSVGAAGPEPGDDVLIARAKAGDTDAFGLLVLRYQDRIWSLCLRMTGSREAALDAAQESFVKAYRAIGRFRENARFYTWLYAIAANTCRNYLRSSKRERRTVVASLDQPLGGGEDDSGLTLADGVASSDAGPDEEARRAEVREAVAAALLRLPQALRRMIVLRDVEGLSYEEIGRALRIKPGTVKSRIHRARHALKAELGEVMDI